MSSATQTRITEIEGRLQALRTDVDGLAPTATVVATLQEQVAALMARLEAAVAAPVKSKGPGRPKMSDEEKAAKAAEKAAKPKPAKAAAEPVGEAPDLEIYKNQTPVDASLCMGRQIADPDARWSKAVYHEKQCSKKPVEDELCATCAKRLVKYLEKPDWKSGWNGRIDEDPADDEQLTLSVHMPGTKWFEDGVTWTGTNKSKSASPEKAAATAAAKEAKAAEKAAAKAVKDAEKEAAKEAKKAEKDAAKTSKSAEKPAKAKTAAKPKAPAGGAAAESVAAVEEAPVSAGYEMCLIDGELRVHKNGNVFELDELTQEPGDYLGRLTGSSDNYGIDSDADQVMSDDE
jgi:hypothetical protein